MNTLPATMKLSLALFLLGAAATVSAKGLPPADNGGQLIINSCTNIVGQINNALGSGAIEEPTKNVGHHVGCITDAGARGPVLQLSLYDTDDDPTGHTDRQRMEIKGNTAAWEATQDNSFYTYSWWLKLNPELVALDTFFHIFQLKTDTESGHSDAAYQNPVFTFSLSRKDGLYMNANIDPHAHTNERIHMLPLTRGHALDQWIHAQVDVKYSHSSAGYVQVILKDAAGHVLFPEHKVTYRTLWPVKYVRPKWGLYRKLASAGEKFNHHDYQLLDDIVLKH